MNENWYRSKLWWCLFGIAILCLLISISGWHFFGWPKETNQGIAGVGAIFFFFSVYIKYWPKNEPPDRDSTNIMDS